MKELQQDQSPPPAPQSERIYDAIVAGYIYSLVRGTA
jgi:hypothetical protein